MGRRAGDQYHFLRHQAPRSSYRKGNLFTQVLNLYQNHVSYIKDLKKYAKSFSCSWCGTLWKDGFKFNRHERTCDAKVHYEFPGGAYKTPPTIVQLLEDEGLTIPDYLKFFPYRATFDFEFMFTPETELNNTEKLTWNAKHIPLSVSLFQRSRLRPTKVLCVRWGL